MPHLDLMIAITKAKAEQPVTWIRAVATAVGTVGGDAAIEQLRAVCVAIAEDAETD